MSFFLSLSLSFSLSLGALVCFFCEKYFSKNKKKKFHFSLESSSLSLAVYLCAVKFFCDFGLGSRKVGFARGYSDNFFCLFYLQVEHSWSLWNNVIFFLRGTVISSSKKKKNVIFAKCNAWDFSLYWVSLFILKNKNSLMQGRCCHQVTFFQDHF